MEIQSKLQFSPIDGLAEKQMKPKERFIVMPCREPDDPMFFTEYLMTSQLFTVDNKITVFDIEIGRGGHGKINYGRVKLTQTYGAVKWQSTEKYAMAYYNELNLLCKCREWPGFPTIQAASEDQNYRCIAMDLLGPSLEDLFESCNRKFSLKTICLVADQIITRLEFLHEQGYVHRDMKPDNLLIGNNYSDVWMIYLIDFGNVKCYLNDNNEHIEENRNNVVGTVRYMSINAHKGNEMSRRDDLMALFNILIYFMRGSLPWQNNSQETLEKTLKVVQSLKIHYTPGLVHDCPEQMKKYHEYVEKMTFKQKPNYAYLRGLFHDLAAKNNITMDNNFDWTAESSKYFQSKNRAIYSTNSETNRVPQNK